MHTAVMHAQIPVYSLIAGNNESSRATCYLIRTSFHHRHQPSSNPHDFDMDPIFKSLYAIARREGISQTEVAAVLHEWTAVGGVQPQPSSVSPQTQTLTPSQPQSPAPSQAQPQIHYFPSNITFETAAKLLATAAALECRQYIAQPSKNHNWTEILRALEAQRHPFDQLEDKCLLVHIWNGNSTSAACKLLHEKFPHRSYNQWLYRYKNLKEVNAIDHNQLCMESYSEEVCRKHFTERFPDIYSDKVVAKSKSMSHDKPDRKWYSFAVFEDWAIVLCLSCQGDTLAAPTIIDAARELHSEFPHRTLCAWNNRCRMMIQMTSGEFRNIVEEAQRYYSHQDALSQLKKRFPEVYSRHPESPNASDSALAWTLNKPVAQPNGTTRRLVRENKKIRFTEVENTATYAHIAMCQTVQGAARQMAHLFPHRSVRAWDKRMRVLRNTPNWKETAQESMAVYSHEATIEHLLSRFPEVYSPDKYRPVSDSQTSRADESFLRKARFDEYEDQVVLVHLSISPTTTATKLHSLFPHRTQQAWRQRTLHVQNRPDVTVKMAQAKKVYRQEEVAAHFKKRFPWVYREDATGGLPVSPVSVKLEQPYEIAIKMEPTQMTPPQAAFHLTPPHLPLPSLPMLAFPLTPPLNTDMGELDGTSRRGSLCGGGGAAPTEAIAHLERQAVLKAIGTSKCPASDLASQWPHKNVYEWSSQCTQLRNASQSDIVNAVETFCDGEMRVALSGHYSIYKPIRRKSWIETVLI